MFGEGLIEIWEMICDYVDSLIQGLGRVVATLASISSLAGQASWWMPSSVFTVFIVAVTLIIVLRIVGR